MKTKTVIMDDLTAYGLCKSIKELGIDVEVVQILPTSPLLQNTKNGSYSRNYIVVYKEDT